ncbi:MAG: hypothetical protein A4E29_00613 [Methanomassiliicoccales archaeon PtaB.Bin134]|nr:MAG: hypothetical protein A4E29_00613 [Methanomassiliicoccales archaeon PtaB.Bin134]
MEKQVWSRAAVGQAATQAPQPSQALMFTLAFLAPPNSWSGAICMALKLHTDSHMPHPVQRILLTWETLAFSVEACSNSRSWDMRSMSRALSVAAWRSSKCIQAHCSRMLHISTMQPLRSASSTVAWNSLRYSLGEQAAMSTRSSLCRTTSSVIFFRFSGEQAKSISETCTTLSMLLAA